MLEKILQNWSLKLLSLVLAVVLWFLVVGQEKAEIGMKVPIVYSGLPKNMLMAGEPIDEVDVRLYGPRNLVRQVASQPVSKAIAINNLEPGEHSFQVVPRRLEPAPGGAGGAHQPGRLQGGAGSPGKPHRECAPRFAGRARSRFQTGPSLL